MNYYCLLTYNDFIGYFNQYDFVNHVDVEQEIIGEVKINLKINEPAYIMYLLAGGSIEQDLSDKVAIGCEIKINLILE